MENSLENKYHLYNRTGFFVHYDELKPKRSIEKDVDDILSSQVIEDLEIDLEHWRDFRDKMKKASQKKKMELRKEMREHVKKLNLMWINRMAMSDRGLQEKMTLFWHGHFACRTIDNPYTTMEMNNLLRKNALGNFRDLLYAVSKSASMIEYLHLKQNKKSSPNEDFARELCELFTLGRDVDYTEKDVVEIARAFTGWTFHEGKHVVNPRQHDTTDKTIFGETGNFGGEDVLEMILANPKCADRIAMKAYKFFVQEELVDAEVKEMSDALFNSNYDIKAMMKSMLTADWFYQKKGRMIKSPIEYLVGMCRMFGFEATDQKSTLGIQYYLGQVLFDPPNVAGWAGGRQWIDSSRLAFRLRLPSLVLNKGYIEDELSPELDAMISKKQKKRDIKFQQEIDWSKFWKRNEGANIFDLVIRTNNDKIRTGHESNEVKTVLHLLSTPDFQMI